jgi:protein-L-isoaspartate O-methyltransferase
LDVLELGTGAGRGTVCLAQRARKVVSVDVGDPAEAGEWVRRYELGDRVTFRSGNAADGWQDSPDRFGLVVLGRGPAAGGLAEDLDASIRLLVRGGMVAVLGYPDPQWPELRRVVDDRADRFRWARVAQADYLGVFRT